MDVLEVRNRVTTMGCIEIGRLPGMVHVGFLMPLRRLEPPALRDLLERVYLNR